MPLTNCVFLDPQRTLLCYLAAPALPNFDFRKARPAQPQHRCCFVNCLSIAVGTALQRGGGALEYGPCSGNLACKAVRLQQQHQQQSCGGNRPAPSPRLAAASRLASPRWRLLQRRVCSSRTRCDVITSILRVHHTHQPACRPCSLACSATGWPGRARRPVGEAAAAAPHPTGAGRDHRPAGRHSAACRHHHAVAAPTTGRGGQSMSGRPRATLGRTGARQGETTATQRSSRAAGEQWCKWRRWRQRWR